MSHAWFQFYGLRMGLKKQETFSYRYGEFLDLVACWQIKYEHAEPKQEADDDEMIPDLR